MNQKKLQLLFFFLALLLGCRDITKEKTITTDPTRFASDFIEYFNSNQLGIFEITKSKIDSFSIDKKRNTIVFYADKRLAGYPFREETIDSVSKQINNFLQGNYYPFNVSIYCLGKPIEELIPNYYRNTIDIDHSRIIKKVNKSVVENLSKPYKPRKGLYKRNIALWPSHGWYYEIKNESWQWQRARLFETVEDLMPLQYTLNYIVPMLENAGANVYLPRERDPQKEEIIIDEQYQLRGIIKSNFSKKKIINKGYRYIKPPFKGNDNPFIGGKSIIFSSDKTGKNKIEWIPEFNNAGEYSVYITYQSDSTNITDAEYTVYHTGGKTVFKVDQTIGGSTWYYLGTFKFKKGMNPDKGKIVLSSFSNMTGNISADAVRFGGGYGVIARGGRTSNKLKVFEAARYYMQYMGMPDTLVYRLNENNDYKDDYQGRGEFVNYLLGAPSGPNKKRSIGLGIPIDLSFALHTDAGITNSDETIGTLSIYSLDDYNGGTLYPNEYSKFANRDFADIMQSEVVNDIRYFFNPDWKRRDLRNAKYSEALRPNVPSVLLELGSHQNFSDSRLMKDPEYQFVVSRAIYKAMVKFLSIEYGKDYVIQPLPVTNFKIEFSKDNELILSWKPQIDELEPTAKAKRYVLYKAVEDNGFDNGTIVNSESVKLKIKKGIIYSFKVTALNEGGESFPSEVLSAFKANNNKPTVLIINGFDRISSSNSFIDSLRSGFNSYYDFGVPYKKSFDYVGPQIDYLKSSNFISNNMPGHGASESAYENMVIAGNTFNYPYIHGLSIKNAGYSFVSCSKKAVEEGDLELKDYKFVDLILGKNKQTSKYRGGILKPEIKYHAFSSKLKEAIIKYLNNQGALFISGSYLASDLFNNEFGQADSGFATTYLKIKLVSPHADQIGEVNTFGNFFNRKLSFNYYNKPNEKLYSVESPDSFYPLDGQIIMRYNNDLPAATFYNSDYKLVLMGIPFETIKNEDIRDLIIKSILNKILK